MAPAVSLMSGGVSPPTWAPDGKVNNLFAERSSRAGAVSAVMSGSDLRHTSAAVIELVIKHDGGERSACTAPAHQRD